MLPVERMSRMWNTEGWPAGLDLPARAAWWAGYGLLLLASMVLALRRFSGAFPHSLSFGPLVLFAAAVILLVGLLRRTRFQAAPWPLPTVAGAAIAFSFSMATAMLMLAVSSSQSSILGLVLAWCGIVAVESSWWTRAIHRCRDGQRTGNEGRTTRGFVEPSPRPSSAISPAHRAADAIPEGVTQQLTRIAEPEGKETLEGWLKLRFDPGVRSQAAHVAFCPPLLGTPEFHVEQMDGPETSIEINQLETYGVRLELRLESAPTEPSEVLIQFAAIG